MDAEAAAPELVEVEDEESSLELLSLDEEPVAEAALLPEVPDEPLVAVAVAAVELQKRELMQDCWHAAYCSVSEAVPLP